MSEQENVAGPAKLSLAVAAPAISLGSGVAQILGTGSRGGWWLVALAGVSAVVMAAILLDRTGGPPRDRFVALIAAVVGGAALAAGIVGGAGLLASGRTPDQSTSGTGGSASSSAPAAPLTPPPTPSPPSSPSADVKTEITSPDTNAVVARCVALEGTVRGTAGKTLVLSNIRDGADEYYFQVVDDWEDVASQTTWSGVQYFGTEPGQKFKVQLLSVDVDLVRSELARVGKGTWHSPSLLKGSVVEDSVKVKQGTDEKSDC